jgi:hypothetical protein
VSVTWQTAGAYDTGTASCAPGIPASTAVGDLLIIGCAFGNGDDTPLDTPAGWTLIPDSLEFGGDGGAYGTDSGNRGVMAFLRIADGTESGTVTVTNPGSGANTRVTQAQIMRFTKTGDAWNVKASNGEDNTDGTGYSVTADSVLIPANGDNGIAVTAWNPDSATAGTPTLTWDGVATTCTQAQTIASTQGADCRFLIFRRNLAGTGGSAPVFATTAGAAVSGATAFILIHDGPAITGQADSSFGFTSTASGEVSAPPIEGQASSPFGFTATSNGVGRALGVATTVLGFTATASGEVRTTVAGQAVSAFGFTATTVGIPETFGQATSSFGFTASSAGVDRALGAAVSSFGFTATSAGVDRALGAVLASFGFTAIASGTVGAPPVTGQGSSAFGFTAQASGIDRALGAAVAAFGFTAQAAGVDRSLGVTVSAFEFATTTAGVVHVVGVTSSAFGFTSTVLGLVRVPAETPPERISTADTSPRNSTATEASRTSAASADGRTSTATPSSRTSS